MEVRGASDLYIFGLFDFRIWHGLHQEPQSEVNQCATLLLFWVRKFEGGTKDRGSIPAKVGFWVGLRMFSYICTPTKITNAISKTQILGPKKGRFLPKIPLMWPFFVFGVF